MVPLLLLLMQGRAALGDDHGVEEDGVLTGPVAVHAAREHLMNREIDAAEAVLHAAGDTIEVVERLALQGLIALERNEFEAAAVAFEAVLAERPTRTAVWLYLGQARFALGEFDDAIEAFEKGAEVGRNLSGYYLLRARAELAVGRPAAAHLVIDEGLQAFPDLAELHREQTIVYLELNLTTEARAAGRRYLDLARDEPFAWLALAEAHERAGHPEEAVILLEEARLRFPGVLALTSRLAHAYAQQGRAGAAGRVFASLLWFDPGYAFKAADQLRVAGAYRAALRANALILEVEQKLPQRLAIFTAAERYERALALEDRLAAAGLRDDPDSLIRLALAALEAGQPARCLELLDNNLGPHEPTAAALRREARAWERAR